MNKLEPVSRQLSSGPAASSRVPPVVYDDPYEEPPSTAEFMSSGVSELSRFSVGANGAMNSFDSRGLGDGASARRDLLLSAVLPQSQSGSADDDRCSVSRLVRENAGQSQPSVTNSSIGTYDEPWDLSSKRRELEDQLRAMPNFGFNLAERSAEAVAQTRSQSSEDGRPFADGYDRPWDLQPHRRDGRDDEGYDKPWDLKPHEKDLRVSVAAAGEYDAPWDIKPRSLVERELIAAKSAKDAAAAAAVAASAQGAVRAITVAAVKGVTDEDKRPAVEYDEPWDQKKKQLLTKAVSETKDSSPAPKPQPRSTSIQSALSVGEKIDPKLPLEQQSWYHGSISRIDAENLLRVHREGSYLVRTSESNRKDYSLSVKSSRGFMHMKIVTETVEGGGVRYILGQFSQPFTSIPLMIHNYTVNKLPIKGAEHTCLLYPVSHELL